MSGYLADEMDGMKGRAMAKQKYRGKLTEPIHPGIIELAQYGGFSNWTKSSDRIKRELATRTLLLFEHYQIDATSPNRWSNLALALANDHVRGFAIVPRYRKRGRPKLTKDLSSKPKRKRGQPQKHTVEDAVELVRIVEGCKKKLTQEQGGRVTDKDTLTHLITSYAKTNKKSVIRTLQSEVPRYQKLLSDASSQFELGSQRLCFKQWQRRILTTILLPQV